MQIIRVARTYPPIVNGTSFHLYELSRHQRGVRLVTLEQCVTNDAGGDVASVPVNLDKIYSSKYHILYFHLRALPKVRRWLSAGKETLLHCHGDIFDVAIELLFRPLLRYRVGLSLHGGVNQSRSYRWLAKPILERLDFLYCTSDAVRENLRANGVKRDIHVITSGINFNDIPKRPLGLNRKGGRFHIVTVGRLHRVKAFGDLIAAADLLGEGFELSIIGDGPERAALNAVIDQRNLGHRVRVTGEMLRDEIFQYLPKCDLFAMSSIKLPEQEEGTPTAMMEGMAAGLPVVSTDTGGVRTLLDGYPELCLVPQHQPPLLAKAIETVATTPFLYEQLQVRSLAIAEDKDWSIVAARVDQVFSSVVANA
jgi:glycosyltransferase involved in cell wall biosynthesis